jgi:hypothetical protein
MKTKYKYTNLGTYKDGDIVTIKFGVHKCKFTSAFPKELEETLTVKHEGYFFMPSYRQGNWDGAHHFITRAGYFSTGVLPIVYCILKKGTNPINNNKKILSTPVSIIKLIIDEKDKKYFNTNFLKYYINNFNLLDSILDTNSFTIPTDLISTVFKYITY